MVGTIEGLVLAIKETETAKLPKTQRYHIDTKNVSIHAYKLKISTDGKYIYLFDVIGKIICLVKPKSITSLDVCRDNYWDVLYNIWTGE